MATIHEVNAEVRSDEGKGASRRLRHAGMVPAIVYGGDQPPKSIQIEHRIVMALAKHEWFFSSVLDLKVDGKSEKVLLRDWQKHPYKLQMMHMDFQRVRAGEKLHTSIPLHFLNQEKSPAGKTSGVVISHNFTEVEVACLPEHLPEYIEVDLSTIDQGDIIHLSELNLPEGVEIPELRHGPEHDLPVVTVHAVKIEVEPTEGEGEEGAAAPAPSASAEASSDEGDDAGEDK
ncbi:50S ribosomal protein L25/general stress protein Ctc [Oleiagrimonas soli]|uniref:Large ribosomal subunit protein bL25 n=1 Tax=Oleiagrimonas soli TaxID=1543381 RepID=A0A099CU81_9GAMM|nr:50S ribosomal protein L25/general stress protein Ctc [Oleiagrimonas soli]KGI77182.1 50S ribosomal protein L25 [Oleiagrimonas soli]MBB6185650.1 large subunit ribosomal protein L25 [Oleiagrimonas soli]